MQTGKWAHLSYAYFCCDLVHQLHNEARAVCHPVAFLGFKVSGVSATESLPFFGQFLFYFFILYLTISVAIMAGYLVYQYHHELNFTSERSTLHQINADPQVDDMAEVDIFIQEGRYEDAQKLLFPWKKNDFMLFIKKKMNAWHG